MQKRKRILGAALGTMLGLGLLFSPYAKLNTVYGANTPVAIDETNFPDAVFREYVKDNFDTDDNGELSVSEMESVTRIEVAERNVADLTGIENFINLKELNCHHAAMSRGLLSSLDVSQNHELQYLICNGNQLSSLDMSQNPKLEHLECNFNQLSSLNVSQNPKLEHLECHSNRLSSLDVSQNPALTYLDCESNRISLTLYQAGSEYYIDLSSLPLETGRVSNPSVGSYNAENGHIEGLTLDTNGSSLTYGYNVGWQNQIMEVTVNISGDPIKVEVTEEPSTEGTTEKQDTAQTTEAVPTEQITTQSTQAENTSQNTPKTGDTMLPVWLAVLGLFSTVCYFAARKGNGIK